MCIGWWRSAWGETPDGRILARATTPAEPETETETDPETETESQSESEPVEVWSSEMTVGTETSVGKTFFGYNGRSVVIKQEGADGTSKIEYSTMGSVASLAFQHDGQWNFVKYLFHQPAASKLSLATFRELGDGLTLVVDGTEFPVGAASGSGSLWRHRWDAPGIDWSVGDVVEVSLLEYPVSDDPVPNREPAGHPVIGGVDGQPTTLQASVADISDDDGLDSAVFEYQWLGRSGPSTSVIDEATEDSYQADLARRLQRLSGACPLHRRRGHPRNADERADPHTPACGRPCEPVA